MAPKGWLRPPMSHPLAAGPDGVLPRQSIAEMVRDKLVTSYFTIDEKQLQPSSLDLRLAEQVYRVQCSFLPGKETIKEKLERYTIHSQAVEGTVLEPGTVYIIPLMEELRLP